MLQWWLLRSMAQDLATIKHTVFLKRALLISCMSEINVKQYNMTAGETSHRSSWIYSSILLAVFSHGVSGQNQVPRGRNRVWFESCPIFCSVAFKCSLSSCAACCSTSHSACLPGGPPLGQVSYCQDRSLNNPPHTHTHTPIVHYCACQPSVQSILPLWQRAHVWWKAKREERRRTARVKKGFWREKRE